MADALSVSGSSNPYVTQSFTAEANDRNTITMTGFFQLLATQLQNQDMTNPMASVIELIDCTIAIWVIWFMISLLSMGFVISWF